MADGLSCVFPQSPDTVVVDTHVNMVTLPDLRAWTWYCVSVQSRYDFYSKFSAFTTPHCMQTEGEELGGVGGLRVDVLLHTLKRPLVRSIESGLMDNSGI